jgi:hypothetical protein
LIRLETPSDLLQPAMLLVTAQVTLTPTEMREFRRRREHGAEVKTWLFDRIAAKDAVRHLWHDLHGERLFPADIEAREEAPGRYRARRRAGPGGADQELPPAAVARAGGVTVALASADPSFDLTVGLDAGTWRAYAVQNGEGIGAWGLDEREES